MRLSQTGLELIKAHEGIRLSAYRDVVGVWTIGYGNTSVAQQGMRITADQADELLRKDVERFELAVNALVIVPISQNQFDSLVSFTFNLGRGALEHSTLLRKLNAGDYAGAANEYGRWVNAGGKPWPGLIRRRKDEQTLFQTPDEAPKPLHWYNEIEKGG